MGKEAGTDIPGLDDPLIEVRRGRLVDGHRAVRDEDSRASCRRQLHRAALQRVELDQLRLQGSLLSQSSRVIRVFSQ